MINKTTERGEGEKQDMIKWHKTLIAWLALKGFTTLYMLNEISHLHHTNPITPKTHTRKHWPYGNVAIPRKKAQKISKNIVRNTRRKKEIKRKSRDDDSENERFVINIHVK